MEMLMVQELTGTPLQFETSSGLVGPSTPQEKDKKKRKKSNNLPHCVETWLAVLKLRYKTVTSMRCLGWAWPLLQLR